MADNVLRRTTGVLFIVISLLMLTCFVLLGIILGYPEILREETGVILTRFHEAGNTAPLLYYGLMISAVLVIFESVLFQRVFDEEARDVFLELGKYAGICAGLAFIFGFMRWVFLVPQLARTYAESGGGLDAETTSLLFRAFDTFLGFSIGEHVGFMFLSLMLGFFGTALIRLKKAPFWIGWCGIIIGLGVLYGDTEAFSWPLSFTVNRVATKLSLIWMITVGIFLVATAPVKSFQGR